MQYSPLHIHTVETCTPLVRPFQKRDMQAIFKPRRIVLMIRKRMHYMYWNYPRSNHSGRHSSAVNRSSCCEGFHILYKHLAGCNCFLSFTHVGFCAQNLLCPYFQQQRKGILKTSRVLLASNKPAVCRRFEHAVDTWTGSVLQRVPHRLNFFSVA